MFAIDEYTVRFTMSKAVQGCEIGFRLALYHTDTEARKREIVKELPLPSNFARCDPVSPLN